MRDTAAPNSQRANQRRCAAHPAPAERRFLRNLRDRVDASAKRPDWRSDPGRPDPAVPQAPRPVLPPIRAETMTLLARPPERDWSAGRCALAVLTLL